MQNVSEREITCLSQTGPQQYPWQKMEQISIKMLKQRQTLHTIHNLETQNEGQRL